MLFPTRWLIRSGFLLACGVSAHAQVTAAAGIAPGHAPEKVQTVPRVPGLSTLFDGLKCRGELLRRAQLLCGLVPSHYAGGKLHVLPAFLGRRQHVDLLAPAGAEHQHQHGRCAPPG